MNEVLRAVGNVEGKIDALLRAHEDEKIERKSLNKRVTSLEKNQWRISGAGTVLIFLIGVIIKLWK